jgi:hypothetical protein
MNLKNPNVKALIKDALTHEDAGDMTGASGIKQKILQIEPKHVAAMNTITGLYGNLGKFEEELFGLKRRSLSTRNFL